MDSRSLSYFIHLHVMLVGTLYGNGRIVPAQAMKASRGRESRVTTLLTLGNRCKYVVSFTRLPTYHGVKAPSTH